MLFLTLAQLLEHSDKDKKSEESQERKGEND